MSSFRKLRELRDDIQNRLDADSCELIVRDGKIFIEDIYESEFSISFEVDVNGD